MRRRATVFAATAVTAAVLLAAFVAAVDAGSCLEAKLCCPGRDSACVVQKTPINAIVEDPTDKPCYCDHACLKLGDCCVDFKPACGVIDCTMSEWEPWSECDTECGSGMMTRNRQVLKSPVNGGKHCPSMVQKRACMGTRCPNYPGSALKETAMLLPASLASNRLSNESQDIRHNLKYRLSKEPVDLDSKEYCVLFEVMKATKACRKVSEYSLLREGERVCVRCDTQAMRQSLGFRCPGHGTMDRATRWTVLSAPHCHGKWVRLESAGQQDGHSCPMCKKGAQFVFV
ncbi:Thrombospondin type-1 (TSP1) repeat,Somatomedin B domain [Cinara cedri]|uniref:Thrombospondin type-1 (TSP1) repeat,Somatomedin B domain n=1 Tax=Cinara cedri TaxID=506608 RepID=A0A5E4MQW6_9HEMI|nr:Thrombospondin type-1 (TSP1) repeat,Somatomedin B domain [Cinara cedri]